ncbi:hypothetical protein GUI12_04630 [Anaplasmataceae bacterium AB001_6]|nr:hypothetical protein GUI12_04630 [Anaplasmataceae bacterium AB001_6]
MYIVVDGIIHLSFYFFPGRDIMSRTKAAKISSRSVKQKETFRGIEITSAVYISKNKRFSVAQDVKKKTPIILDDGTILRWSDRKKFV